ncbi:nuclear transport factor 2 family protein [Novosphingobium sp. ST904]|uniref:nuclear transport factor 2 family protein n=1 Tax=Novosphingobium sp. ST904 TaxID=1684385 RepID=UPI0006C8DF8A|nr:nuclear transport factor 2 family protein [Novosphingobium sp. ST904]KPH59612.1 hypothetical protein ADT71_22845 [Novosphingobium sp. ST904]TCM38080.1 uncharacterized protein DUF4440 [Novosphingobium sp. ST904]
MTRLSNSRILLAAALGCALVPGIALADTKGDIEARYEQLRVAMDSREPAQIKPLLAADFVRTDLGGNKMSAEQMIEGLTMVPVDPDRKSATTVQSVTLKGDVAEVDQQQVASDTREGRDGQTHTFGMTSISHDTWVKSEKGWLLRTTETQSMTISRDGTVMRTINKGEAMAQGRRGSMGPPTPAPGSR